MCRCTKQLEIFFEKTNEYHVISAEIVIRTYHVSKPEHPLNTFVQLNHFKLFLFDVGLLKHMAGISNEAILLKKDYQFKGALTENLEKFHPKQALRFSKLNYQPTEHFTNIPLYLTRKIKDLL